MLIYLEWLKKFTSQTMAHFKLKLGLCSILSNQRDEWVLSLSTHLCFLLIECHRIQSNISTLKWPDHVSLMQCFDISFAVSIPFLMENKQKSYFEIFIWYSSDREEQVFKKWGWTVFCWKIRCDRKYATTQSEVCGSEISSTTQNVSAPFLWWLKLDI